MDLGFALKFYTTGRPNSYWITPPQKVIDFLSFESDSQLAEFLNMTTEELHKIYRQYKTKKLKGNIYFDDFNEMIEVIKYLNKLKNLNR